MLWLNCVSEFSCNDSYINQGREARATNQSLTIFSVSNTVKKQKILWFCLEFQIEHLLKDNKQILLLNTEAEKANNKSSQLYFLS